MTSCEQWIITNTSTDCLISSRQPVSHAPSQVQQGGRFLAVWGAFILNLMCKARTCKHLPAFSKTNKKQETSSPQLMTESKVNNKKQAIHSSRHFNQLTYVNQIQDRGRVNWLQWDLFSRIQRKARTDQHRASAVAARVINQYSTANEGVSNLLKDKQL